MQAVSESLNSLAKAAAQDGASEKAVDSSAPAARRPSSSEAAESKAAAGDVMVQITARKSEVGLSQLFCQ